MKTNVPALVSLVAVALGWFRPSADAQSSYFQAVTHLNPVGYWPMHETTPAVHGDIETNYGSAGPLANGFYADWVHPSPGGTMLHQFMTGIPGDPNPILYFNTPFPNTTGNMPNPTNYLEIPHLSPAMILSPPFTVETWYYWTNNLNAGRKFDLYSSVNALGSQPGLNGNLAFAGFRLFVNDYFNIYSYDNDLGVNSPNSAAPITFGAWNFIVLTVDAGTNMNLYLNGNNVISNWNAGYAPNVCDPFEIDTGKGYTRDASGLLQDFAIYTNSLSADDIMAHYNAGITSGSSPSYSTLVFNDHPTVYFRMDSPAFAIPPLSAWPVLTNYGSAAANGVYTPGTIPGGAAGPNNGPLFATGFGANAGAMPVGGMSTFADAGASALYNPTGPQAFSISAWFQGAPCDSRAETIVGHGAATSWAIVMNGNGHLQCQLGTNTASSLTSAGLYNDGNWHQVIEVYTPASAAGVTGTNALYVDGVLDSQVGTVTASGILPGTNLDVMIGTDPAFTNSPVAIGQQFEGNICEVALFTNALTPSMVSNLYFSAFAQTVNTQPTNIIVTVSGNLLTLTWPFDHTGWQLQAQTNGLNAGLGANWVNISASTTTNEVIIPIDSGNGSVFYRLTYQ